MAEDYKVIEKYNRVLLEEAVDRALSEGYKLKGGVSVAINEQQQTLYVQAVQR